MAEDECCKCETPCWSGVWMETEGHGYMEISDSDERFHRPPPGWALDTVHHNVFNSSQIFRYVPVPAEVKSSRFIGPSAALVALGVTGVGVGARPMIDALLALTQGGFFL